MTPDILTKSYELHSNIKLYCVTNTLIYTVLAKRIPDLLLFYQKKEQTRVKRPTNHKKQSICT